MLRIVETRSDGVLLPSRPPLHAVQRGSVPRRAAIEPWEMAVLVVLALVLIGVTREGLDFSGILLTGWIHP